MPGQANLNPPIFFLPGRSRWILFLHPSRWAQRELGLRHQALQTLITAFLPPRVEEANPGSLFWREKSWDQTWIVTSRNRTKDYFVSKEKKKKSQWLSLTLETYLNFTPGYNISNANKNPIQYWGLDWASQNVCFFLYSSILNFGNTYNISNSYHQTVFRVDCAVCIRPSNSCHTLDAKYSIFSHIIQFSTHLSLKSP